MPRRLIDPTDLASTADVADRLGLAHQASVTNYARKWSTFPRPIARVGRGRTALYLMSEVEAWLTDHQANVKRGGLPNPDRTQAP